MKKGILVVLATLALAVFAVPDSPAEAWWGHHYKPRVMHLTLSGSNFVTSSQDSTAGEDYGRPTPVDGRVLTALANGIALGKHERALFTTQSVLEELGAQSGCENEAYVGGAGVTTTTVLTYEDGSLLTLSGPLDPEDPDVSFYCTDGVNFTVKFRGTVNGGTGRFEGATGTWEGTALAEGGTGRVTAKLKVKLDRSRPSHHGDRH